LLLNNLYTIQAMTENEKGIQASAMLRPDHAIFKGHFPGQPVLPGVCMLEMITEITGRHLNQRLRITEAPLIKFLNMIDPGKDPLIHFEIGYDSPEGKTTVKGRIYSGSRVFMKFQMTVEPLSPIELLTA
jgi:3-hydroxyacyl-[acyl-carrier-protein] dehydratase